MVVAICLFLGLSGCSSSGLVNVWGDAPFENASVRKMLVISVGKSDEQRRICEDAFAAGLLRHRVMATPSYTLFPLGVPDTTQVFAIVVSKGYDAVLVSRWSLTDHKALKSQGFATNELDLQYIPCLNTFVKYYGEAGKAAYRVGKIRRFRAVDVWTTRTIVALVWSGTGEVPESTFSQSQEPEIVDLVLSNLSKQGVIASRQP